MDFDAQPDKSDSRRDDAVSPYAAPQPALVEADSSTEAGRPSGFSEATDRWWTPLLIAGLSFFAYLAGSAVASVIALAAIHGDLTFERISDVESYKAITQSRLGFGLVVVIPQLILVTPAVAAARLSSVPTRKRLGLVAGHWPVWSWFAAAAATPLVGMVSGVVVGVFMEESEVLRETSQIFRGFGESGFLVPLALMIGMTPALCEELLFRGYIQTRLVRSWGPLAGIATASLLFAGFHLDPVHVTAVLPLGLFLGWITWQSGSLFPAMLAHFVNNVISVVLVVLSQESEPDVLALPAAAALLVILGLGVVGMAAVSLATVLYGRPPAAEPVVG